MDDELLSAGSHLDPFQKFRGVPSKCNKLDRVHLTDEALLFNANNFTGNIAHGGGIYNTVLSLGSAGVLEDQQVLDFMRKLVGPREVTVESPGSEPESSQDTIISIYRELEEAKEKGLDEMETRSQKIVANYHVLLEKCKTATSGFASIPESLKNIEQDIDDQRRRFEFTIKSLRTSISGASLEDTKHSNWLYTQVHEQMNAVFQGLEGAQPCFERILGHFKERENAKSDEQARERTARSDAESKAVLSIIDGLLDKLDEQAQPLVRKLLRQRSGSESRLPPDELQRLSRESLAVATLCQGFCRACPDKKHQRHTAYLSLASDNNASPETRMAILSRAKAEKPIWFRVVSETNVSSAAVTTKTQQEQEANRLKRRRSSEALIPPAKTSKTEARPLSRHQSDTAIDTQSLGTPILIQICPEYLEQHEEPQFLAMQMNDSPNVIHNIYFLPAKKRPSEECKPVSLDTMLIEPHNPVEGDEGHLFWQVRVARLIAEAALRFDCPAARCRWHRGDIMFYSLQTSDDLPEPFLKVEIEDEISDQLTSRNTTLLNVAFMLLEIGLSKPIDIPKNWDNERKRSRILELAAENDVQIPGNYFAVVRSCAELSAMEEAADVDEERFREQYYERIISPLKAMEDNLWSIRRKMNKLTLGA